MNDAEIAIVGDSIAGCFAAYLLGALGFPVLIIAPPKKLSKVKACGEGLSSLGKKYLSAAGLWSESLEAAAKPFYGYDIRAENQQSVVLRGSRPIGYGIQRSILDNHLRRAALSLSNVTLVPEEVDTCIIEGGTWSLSTPHKAITARHLLLGCGLHARRLLKSSEKCFQSKRFGIVLHVEGVWSSAPPRHVVIHNSKHMQIVLTSFAGGETNISV